MRAPHLTPIALGAILCLAGACQPRTMEPTDDSVRRQIEAQLARTSQATKDEDIDA